MELKDLETFVTVVKAGSMTRAAEVLHLTQPGASRRIDRLEKSLDCPLFERVGNQILLTKEGKTLLPHAEAILRRVRECQTAIDVEKKGWQSAFIAISATLAETPFTDRLKDLREHFPHMRQLHIQMLGSEEVSDKVDSGEADLGFRFFHDKNDQLEYVPLGQEPLVVVCARESSWHQGESRTAPLSPRDLDGIPWIAFPQRKNPPSHITTILDEWLDQEGVQPGYRIDADCLAAQQKLVQADFGISLQPYSSVQEATRNGKLRMIPLPGLSLRMPIFAIYRKSAPHRDRLLEMIQLFRWE